LKSEIQRLGLELKSDFIRIESYSYSQVVYSYIVLKSDFIRIESDLSSLPTFLKELKSDFIRIERTNY